MKKLYYVQVCDLDTYEVIEKAIYRRNVYRDPLFKLIRRYQGGHKLQIVITPDDYEEDQK